jgi:hypothetical protein
MKFDKGTPEEYVILRRDFEEVWAQQVMTTGCDHAATVCSLLRNESLTMFETSLADQRTSVDPDGETLETETTIENVNEALHALSKSVFPTVHWRCKNFGCNVGCASRWNFPPGKWPLLSVD